MSLPQGNDCVATRKCAQGRPQSLPAWMTDLGMLSRTTVSSPGVSVRARVRSAIVRGRGRFEQIKRQALAEG